MNDLRELDNQLNIAIYGLKDKTKLQCLFHFWKSGTDVFLKRRGEYSNRLGNAIKITEHNMSFLLQTYMYVLNDNDELCTTMTIIYNGDQEPQDIYVNETDIPLFLLEQGFPTWNYVSQNMYEEEPYPNQQFLIQIVKDILMK